MNMPFQIDEERTKKNIDYILEKIRIEADPALLDEYYDIFKKEVSLFNRNKVAAYLLMMFDQGKSSRYTNRNYHRAEKPNTNEGHRNESHHTDGRRYPLADEESVRLFFSAGRSRRVYPREILGIINTKTAIPKEDIGAIRILDNYSFVQVRDSVAGKIIEALNGMVFRGRPLTVNYAKTREISDDCQDNPQEENI